MPNGGLTRACSHRLNPQLAHDLLSPTTDPVCTGGQRKKQEPHVSTPHTQPPSQPGTMSLTSPRQTINYWRGEMWWGSSVSTQRTHAFSCGHVALKCLYTMKRDMFCSNCTSDCCENCKIRMLMTNMFLWHCFPMWIWTTECQIFKKHQQCGSTKHPDITLLLFILPFNVWRFIYLGKRAPHWVMQSDQLRWSWLARFKVNNMLNALSFLCFPSVITSSPRCFMRVSQLWIC